MPYPWECIDCNEYYRDLVKNGMFYCTKMHRNVSLNERSCNTYFIKRDKNRPLDKKQGGNCYITTAVVDILGYEDNCETLETLRVFRDNYMKKQERYIPLLKDYDTVGPLISDKLWNDDNKEKVATLMLNVFIQESICAIKDKEYNAAINTYENMTYYLMDYYNIDMDLLSYQSKSFERKRTISQK